MNTLLIVYLSIGVVFAVRWFIIEAIKLHKDDMDILMIAVLFFSLASLIFWPLDLVWIVTGWVVKKGDKEKCSKCGRVL